jgi:hypothetical protein
VENNCNLWWAIPETGNVCMQYLWHKTIFVTCFLSFLSDPFTRCHSRWTVGVMKLRYNKVTDINLPSSVEKVITAWREMGGFRVRLWNLENFLLSDLLFLVFFSNVHFIPVLFWLFFRSISDFASSEKYSLSVSLSLSLSRHISTSMVLQKALPL